MTNASAQPAGARRRLGSTELDVTSVCIGTSPLGDMPQLYGSGVDEETAVETVLAALAGPYSFLDTSNGYGANGESERRIGLALARAGGLRDGYVLATKVDPAQGSSDFSGARVRASFEESLERLGVDRIQLLHLHDPERISFEQGMAPGGPVEALLELRDQGLVDYIGVAGGTVSVMRQYVATGHFDVLLNHNRFTLLDRSADTLYDEAHARGMGVLNAAPYGGGMLVKGPEAQPRYAYGQGSDDVADAARAMQAVCDRHGVPLAAAALQFSVRDPRIHSTVVGMSSPRRINQTTALLEQHVPDEVWAELDALVPARDLWLDAS
ncbi:aldo/keto reductase [Planctomonas psychrotolerans]|uniref:aldo/keto reductase n=1 Tax=Planctomonas psychrotolerans TaxID=2528712 RepID=UPI001238EBE9|nr:aldo/keto reductase [Planctomonas psychrotolerans]